MWVDSGGDILEGALVESAWKKCIVDEGGGNWGGGTNKICDVLPPGAEDGEIPGGRLSKGR